jgi:levanase/fructan beta-fructosidase
LGRSSLEVSGNDDEKVIPAMIYPDTDATGLSVFAKGKAVIKSLKMWDLNRKQ